MNHVHRARRWGQIAIAGKRTRANIFFLSRIARSRVALMQPVGAWWNLP